MIAFVADVHLGNHRNLGGAAVGRLNERFRETLKVFAAACKRARQAGADTLVVLGDLFDGDDPSPPMVRATLDALREGPSRVYLLLGNHEKRSDQRHDNALSSMAGTWGRMFITVVEKPVTAHAGGDLFLMLVPFQNGRASDWLPGAIREAASAAKDPVLCLHLGISDEDTTEYLTAAEDQIDVDELFDMMDSRGIVATVAGNWHKRQTWDDDGLMVYQLGALCPTGWNNPGGDEHYGTLLLWDGEEFTREVIPGPRYLKFSSVAEWEPHGGSELVRSRIVVAANRVGMAREQVERAGSMGVVEVLADEKTTQKRALAAGVAAREAADDDEALIEYCKRIEKPRGVRVGAVLAEVKGYLRRANDE